MREGTGRTGDEGREKGQGGQGVREGTGRTGDGESVKGLSKSY